MSPYRRLIYNAINYKRKNPHTILESDIDQIDYLLKHSHSPELILYNCQRTSIVTYFTGKNYNPFPGTQTFELTGTKLLKRVRSQEEKSLFKNCKTPISKLEKKQIITSKMNHHHQNAINLTDRAKINKKRAFSVKHYEIRALNDTKKLFFSNNEKKIGQKYEKSIQVSDSSFTLNGWSN